MENGLLAFLGVAYLTSCQPEEPKIITQPRTVETPAPKPRVFFTSPEQKKGLKALQIATQELRTYQGAQEFAHFRTLQSKVGTQKNTEEYVLGIGLEEITLSVLDPTKAWNYGTVTATYHSASEKIDFGGPWMGSSEGQVYAIPSSCDTQDTFCIQYQQAAEDFKTEARRIHPLLIAAQPLLQEEIEQETQKIKQKVPGYFKEAQKSIKGIPTLEYCATEWNVSMVEGESVSTGPNPSIYFSHNAMDSCDSGFWTMRWSEDPKTLKTLIDIKIPLECGTKEKRMSMEINDQERGKLQLEIDVSQRTEENAEAYDLYTSPIPENWRTEALKKQRKLQACHEGP
ncbi:hypothetical protein EXS74_02930 [Candidatus Woesearchaeota archaeon]|nr:hypothetical protein [Candidatus Woesearchaeota archaeon]